MRFLADAELYSDPERCLEWLRGLPAQPSAGQEPQHCHVYWHGPIGRKQTMVLKSFLATQDVARLRLVLWIDREDGFADHERSEALAPLLPYLDVRPYDPAEQSQGTPLEDRLDLYGSPGPTARSNFARLTILHNVGGIYVDVDTVFLRDLGELPTSISGDELCTQWSSIPRGNNAFIGLRPHGAVAVGLMERAAATDSCRPSSILAFEGGQDIDLLVLPAAVTDPLWTHHEGTALMRRPPIMRFDDFFSATRRPRWRRERVRSYRDFFRGAFAYHWHNRWDAPIHGESYFARFEREFDQMLVERGILPRSPARAAADTSVRLPAAESMR